MPKWDPHLIEIERCLIEGVSTFLRAKQTYWPIEGNTEPHETNLVLHAAAAFTRAGHLVYGEVHPAGSGTEQVDLVVLGPGYDCEWAFALEAKRLHSSEKASSLGDDAQRLARLTLPNRDSERLKNIRYFSGLIASCWNRKRKQWWEDPSNAPIPSTTKQELWASLGQYLAASKRSGAIDVSLDEPHWVLYALADHGRR